MKIKEKCFAKKKMLCKNNNCLFHVFGCNYLNMNSYQNADPSTFQKYVFSFAYACLKFENYFSLWIKKNIIKKNKKYMHYLQS